MKIVITGGLGYVGSELCKLYSGETRTNEVVVFDNRFLPERVRQLRVWGIKFVQGSILDFELVKKVLGDADVVHHLAGVTDVAYVKTEANTELDKNIRKVAMEGTQNVLAAMKEEAKLIFPSTHVVFEGLPNVKLYVNEDEPVYPVLAYASSKAANEQQIREIGINYVICRLGSVYGASTDSMRINIMPNLFSKITALNGEIKLFGGGVQYKSLVHVTDVARCLKFFAESAVTRETFHLASENLRVKEVAAICKAVNPNVTITVTDDEVPNAGYTLSNQKLIDTGFKFLYNITDAIQEMVSLWSERSIFKGNERVIQGCKEFVDERGKISNYELPESVNLIGWIESKSGTIRANHYHPIQEQKCLLVSGSYISVTKDLLKRDSQIETKLILPGDVAVIPPNVAHAMIFTRDSVFLNLVNGEREHKNYGVTHTIPYMLVDEKLATFLTQ